MNMSACRPYPWTERPVHCEKCGMIYDDKESWQKLKWVGFMGDVEERLELRNCPCGTTHSRKAPLAVQSFGLDELRRATRLFERTSLYVVDSCTVEELLNIARACWASDWDLFPDQWSKEQVARAALNAEPPRFEERRGWIHALDVTDCNCRACDS